MAMPYPGPKEEENNENRRIVLQSLGFGTLFSLLLFGGPTPSCFASNLPASTGADTSMVGTVQSLIPIVALKSCLVQMEVALLNPNKNNAKEIQYIMVQPNIPSKEEDFKRLFDAYSDPVSYKQKFLDQNAFLVYYTKGFDGPGRANIEDDINERQTLQFGARNEAWIAWENVLLELKFLDDPDNDVAKYLKETIRAVDAYLKLAPPQDIEAAKQTLKVTIW